MSGAIANIDEYFMNIACEMGNISIEKGGGPFGCVITDENDNIVETGHNMVTINNDPTQHAEIVAIRNACKKRNTYNLTGCKLYTSCEPCPMCLSAIYWARIDIIYYANTREDAAEIGFSDNYIYEELNKPLCDRSIPIIRINNTEYAKQGFTMWTQKLNKKYY
jgi:tRNA(Arg) A34 adenosine deaminase TadA